MFRFEKLDVWNKAIDYADLVYSVTKSFPGDERFGLTSQMRRSAVSVSSNVAEGTGRSGDKDFARFIEIGYGSLMECVSQSHIAVRQEFMKKDEFAKIHTDAEELARMLSGLRNVLLK
jgi:four helix bundle protein